MERKNNRCSICGCFTKEPVVTKELCELLHHKFRCCFCGKYVSVQDFGKYADYETFFDGEFEDGLTYHYECKKINEDNDGQ